MIGDIMDAINNFYDIFDLDDQKMKIQEIKNFIKFNSIDSIDKQNRNTLLLAAIADNNIEIVKYLIREGANINGDRTASFYPLERAAITGNVEIITALDETNKLEYHRKADQSLIYAISFHDSIQICSFLLEKGMNPNVKDKDGYTPLFWAMQHQDLIMIKKLIEYGADVNVISSDGQTPLYQSAGDNNMDEVRLLIKSGAVVDLTESCTPFMIACAYEHFEVAQELLQHGADVNFKDNEGRTALFYAIVKQNSKTVNFLKSVGATDNTTDNFGISIQDLCNEDVREKLQKDLF